nr:MAG TPA: hypothetical protein [Caudoviricetes sp.]
MWVFRLAAAGRARLRRRRRRPDRVRQRFAADRIRTFAKIGQPPRPR